MVSTRKQKKVTARCSSPLDTAAILQQVLDFVGPGHSAFISGVSKAWQLSYTKVADSTVPKLKPGSRATVMCTAKMTLYSAAMASGSRLSWACDVMSLQRDAAYYTLQKKAGRYADAAVLVAAVEYGLSLSPDLAHGAAESCDVLKLQYLHKELGCRLPRNISESAARSGSVELFTWLKQNGHRIHSEKTLKAAIELGHLLLLQFLRADGCALTAELCNTAAKYAQLDILRWLHEQGCEWDRQPVSDYAAESGSVPMLKYLRKQHGVVFDAYTMRTAADKGHTAACCYLRSVSCPWNEDVSNSAAAYDHMRTLRVLIVLGCPWRAHNVCAAAARSSDTELLAYAQTHAAVTASELTEALNAAGAHGQLAAAQWLKQQGIAWPAKLVYMRSSYIVGGDIARPDKQWCGEALAWARTQGCTSLIG
jgi:hypothetical protein